MEKELLKVEETQTAAEKNKLKTEAEKVKTAAEALGGQRGAITAKIEKKILSLYEKLLINRSGLAVAPVVGGSCQGCFALLPPQIINEITMKNQMVICDGCARILYSEE